ncbi:MAG: toxin-antitoxin system HicB family antitoxin [Saprospiraceae bacterium]|nr:toxin-antitoxin system HicB family antitoxin [Saprospiraceae bacterium]
MIPKSFKEAVEDYIELCLSLKKSPYKSFKGTFNVRIKPSCIQKLSPKLFSQE